MIYFDNASTSHPKAPGVSNAMKNILDQGCFNINRGGYSDAYEISSLVFDTREKIAKLFGAKSPRNVVFSSGITHSLNIALKGLLSPGDHVVTTQMEHNSVIRPLAQLKTLGVVVDVVRCDSSGMLDLDEMRKKITDNTKLVVITHASNVCGSIQPIREVGKLCREHGTLLLVDSAQTAGVLQISMECDHVDMLAFTAHKGLLSAPGLGGLVLSQNIADKITPLIAGGTGSHTHIETMPNELPDKLEAGTMNIPGIAALSASLDYINEIGIDHIYENKYKLLTFLTGGLQALESVHILGPENLNAKCAIVALDFKSLDNATVSARLDEEFKIMTRCGLHCAPNAHKALGTFPHGVVRCSIGHKNTKAEIDELLRAVEAITNGN